MKKVLILAVLLFLIGLSLVALIATGFDFLFGLNLLAQEYRPVAVCSSALLLTLLVFLFGAANRKLHLT